MKRFNWYKWILFAAIAVALFLYGRKCGSDSQRKSIEVPIFKTDTIWKDTGTRKISYVPKPYKIIERDTVMQRDTLKIETKYYSDTVKVDFGKIYLQDTVTDNTIVGRGVISDLKIPTITNSVTIYEPQYMPKAIVYWGLSVRGSKQNYLYSLSTDFSLKTKNDKIYTAEVGLTKDNQVMFGIGYKLPIKLKR